MGRDYAVVVEKNGKLRFKKNGPEFHVNVWGVEFYGRIFAKMGLPTDPLYHSDPKFRAFKHEFKKEDLDAIKAAVAQPDFAQKLVDAVAEVSKEMDYTMETPKEVAAGMMAEMFSVFILSEAVAVASDYCEEYCNWRTG